jgi:hypothetical protein
MSKRILDHDPYTGITTYHSYNHDTKQTLIERTQHIAPILDRNKALAADSSYRQQGMKESWWHAATIPAIVIEKWLKEEGIDVFNEDHMPKVKAKLNSSEYAYLRTSTGRI